MARTDAMRVTGRLLRRMKRPWRVTADLHDFASFPSAVDGIDGPFRCSVRPFASEYARIASPATSRLRSWRIPLLIDDRDGKDEDIVELDVVEEDVESSTSVYCDHCRVVGWSWIPVCTKRYHFIIRNGGNPVTFCCNCGIPRHFAETRCSCDHEMTTGVLEDRACLPLLEDTTHLLHGVVHANGYGHLLRVNGREGGSGILTGRDLMEFWDRLCKSLHVRKVSVMDASKKYGMEYRLLHAVTSGHSWYGEWGYQFGAGSFALTADAYQNSVENLSNIPLSLFSLQQHQNQLHNTIEFYMSLSDHKLETFKDLFCFITKLIRQCHEEGESLMEAKQLSQTWSGPHVVHAWSEQEVRHADEAIMKILQAVKGSKWVTWRALKGATFRSIGAEGLLDYCLKRFWFEGKSTHEGSTIAVRYNDETSSTEYRLQPAATDRFSGGCPGHLQEHLISDLKFFYNTLLNPMTMQPYKPQSTWASAQSSAQKILDCKQFIKHYDDYNGLIASDLPALRMWCHLELVDHPKDYSAPPPELLMLPITATVADLKYEAKKAFHETYLIFQRLQVQQLVNYEAISDTTQVKFLLGEIAICRVRGKCYDSEYLFKQFRSEKGTENWTVDCACGAKDDDGERMLACDVCGVWQHTRCIGINDSDDVPSKFICQICMQNPKHHHGTSTRMYKQSESCQNSLMSQTSGKAKSKHLLVIG